MSPCTGEGERGGEKCGVGGEGVWQWVGLLVGRPPPPPPPFSLQGNIKGINLDWC